ncbi:hypothetical protein GMOD_00005003 [Pyrenophora seminiperda CCB06]|uniref:Uncharacterized protein n=1 Tax=Pyrenophora seminiperda CCB06 TaxID=1302712 RepID=A0A3M7MIG8_9PLEO|nr:hypothetical protein GMOD_00005003 [Pyrenophora seminiperda CCB06]
MGRFEGLNEDTKDLVTCLLPALAASFGLSDPVDIIPEDIRMRAWDCERRDHIKEETENDPRNWGVQFLKDLKAISRLNHGNLVEFHEILRGKVALHEPKHPWCRLADIKAIKDEYEHPEKKNKVVVVEEESSSSTDSYFEELVEPDMPRGKKRAFNSGRHEIYEARVMEKRRKRKLWLRRLPFSTQCASVAPPPAASSATTLTPKSAIPRTATTLVPVAPPFSAVPNVNHVSFHLTTRPLLIRLMPGFPTLTPRPPAPCRQVLPSPTCTM